MKAHKFWSIGACFCMLMAMLSGFHCKSKEVHKYWAFGAFGFMLMSMYSGYRMIHRKAGKPTEKKQEENRAEKEIGS